MAREVNTVLAQIIAEARGVSEAKGEEIVKNMRSANQYQVRSVYTDPSRHIIILLLTGFHRRMFGHKKNKRSATRCI
jgi:hypothetical protein